MTNRQRTTLAAFLAYAIMSGLLTPIGVLSPTISAEFGVAVTVVTSKFGWLTFGILVGAALAIELTPRVQLRPLLVGLYATTCVGIVGLTFAPGLSMIGPILGILGVTAGVGLAAAALTITRNFQASHRASMLVVTDACFSLAGVAINLLAGYAIAQNWPWATSYLTVALAALLVMTIALGSKFPAADTSGDSATGVWPVRAWIAVAALGLYTLGQQALLLWLPVQMQQSFGASALIAGSVVGNYWLGMLGAQLFVAAAVLKTGLRNMLRVAAIATVLTSVPLWATTETHWLPWLALLFGFMNLGLLKLLISLATEQLPTPTPRLVSTLLLGATAGTAISPALTSHLVEWLGIPFVLRFATFAFAALAIVTIWLANKPALESRLQNNG